MDVFPSPYRMEIGLPVFSTFSETHSCTSRMDGKSPNITLNISRREEAWASSAHSGDTRGFSAASERHELGPSTVQWNISDGIFDGIYDYVRYMLSVLSMHYRSISVVAAPFTQSPTVFGWAFSCPQRHGWRGSAPWPLERHSATTLVFGAISPAFLSLFSVWLLSGQEARSSNDAGFRASGCACELVDRGRLRMNTRMSCAKKVVL
jgi:hypothetical protein